MPRQSPKKNRKKLERAFGLNEWGMVDIPTKFSNIKISRFLVGRWMGCEYCFPHGYETINSRWEKDLRCWKRYRKTQWRPKDDG